MDHRGGAEVDRDVTRVVHEVTGFGVVALGRGRVVDLVTAHAWDLDLGGGERPERQTRAVETHTGFGGQVPVRHTELADGAEHGVLFGDRDTGPRVAQRTVVELDVAFGQRGRVVTVLHEPHVVDRMRGPVPPGEGLDRLPRRFGDDRRLGAGCGVDASAHHREPGEAGRAGEYDRRQALRATREESVLQVISSHALALFRRDTPNTRHWDVVKLSSRDRNKTSFSQLSL